MKDIEDNDDTRERNAGELTSFKWVLTREKEYELTVLIEYDRKYHDTGIYYGCRIENAKECSDNKIEYVISKVDVEQIKKEFYQYWVLREHLPKEGMDKIFLTDRNSGNLDHWI